jgi:hypothetical protein
MQNQATLTGYLGKDGVLRTTRKRTPFAVFSLATHRSWKDRSSGKRQSVTEWHRCVVSGKLAAYAGTLTKITFNSKARSARASTLLASSQMARAACSDRSPRSVCSAS